MSGKRIYVSGPMTGLPEHNLPAFAAAAQALADAGYEPLDPGRHGVDPTKTWSDYLRRDLQDLLTCDGVALLPGWVTSKGATLEVHVARALGMNVRLLSTWLQDPS